MTVYVDDVRLAFGRMVMCHMWADSLEELHEMADAIGVSRRWFQEPPKASWRHYDIALAKKTLALERGAVLTDRYGPLEHVARQTGNHRTLDKIAEARRRRGAGFLQTRPKPDLFGGALPSVPAAVMREADVLLTAVPPPPAGLCIDRHALPAARVLERQGRGRLVWLPEPGVYYLRRTANAG